MYGARFLLGSLVAGTIDRFSPGMVWEPYIRAGAPGDEFQRSWKWQMKRQG